MHGNQANAVIFNAGWTLPCSKHSGILLYLCDLSCCSILKSGREVNLPHYLSCVYFYAVTTTQPITQRDVFTWNILQVLNCSLLNLGSVKEFAKEFVHHLFILQLYL